LVLDLVIPDPPLLLLRGVRADVRSLAFGRILAVV
jgi:hypothetical protein